MNIKQQWIAYKTIIIKELHRSTHIWTQTFIPPLITTALYYIIFGYVVGQRLGTFEGYSYIQFIAPGLIMLAVISSSYGAAVSSFFIAKFQRSIEELLVSPTTDNVMLLGYISSGIMRGIIIAILVTLTTLFFTHLHIHSLLCVAAVVLLSSAIFSLGGLINAIYAKRFDDTAFIPTFVLTPLTYLGGVFFPLSLLHANWQWLALCNPVFYIIEALRYGFLGISSKYIVISFAVMALLVIVLFTFTLYLFKKGVGLRT